MTNLIRINRFFTDSGIISRREADRAIEQGRVFINGKRAALGAKVCETDTITLDGSVVAFKKQKKPIILAYNKPVGIECTSDTRVPDNIIDAVNVHERIFHIGRLDKNSQGLILLTNLGDIVNKILRSKFHNEKEYIVELSRAMSGEEINAMSKGIRLDDGWTKPCRVERLSARKIRIVLTEGRNRQIRRMVEYFGLKVVTLDRVRIMNIRLGSLPLGRYRQLTDSEQKKLLESLDNTNAPSAKARRRSNWH